MATMGRADEEEEEARLTDGQRQIHFHRAKANSLAWGGH